MARWSRFLQRSEQHSRAAVSVSVGVPHETHGRITFNSRSCIGWLNVPLLSFAHKKGTVWGCL